MLAVGSLHGTPTWHTYMDMDMDMARMAHAWQALVLIVEPLCRRLVLHRILLLSRIRLVGAAGSGGGSGSLFATLQECTIACLTCLQQCQLAH